MNILQLITELWPGGAERVVVNLSRELVAAGHSVRVCSLRSLPGESPILDDFQNAGIPVFSLGLSYVQPWRALSFPKMVEHIGRLDANGNSGEFVPDVVHAHLFHAGLLAATVRPERRAWQLVYTVHVCDRRPRRDWQFMFETWLAHRCQAVTTVSAAVRDYYAARAKLEPGWVDVVPNGIHLPSEVTPGQATALRHEWGFADCARVLGSVGRLDWQKGYDLLLESLPELAARIPRGEVWGVVILGDGPQRAQLEKLAAHVPGNIRVVLPGFRKDAPSCIGAFDLFLMPSRYEGYGLTLAEAMTHGVPVVASPVDSIPEVLGNYPNGLIAEITSGHWTAWNDAVMSLAPRSERHPRPPHSVQAMTADYEAVYRRLLASRSSSPRA